MPAVSSDLIFDIGMHNGEDSEFYLKKGFRVVAVEAVESLCTAVAEQLAESVDTRRLVIVNKAIAAQFGVPYYLKIDIEGADLICLDSLRSTGARPSYVSIESNKTSCISPLGNTTRGVRRRRVVALVNLVDG